MELNEEQWILLVRTLCNCVVGFISLDFMRMLYGKKYRNPFIDVLVLAAFVTGYFCINALNNTVLNILYATGSLLAISFLFYQKHKQKPVYVFLLMVYLSFADTLALIVCSKLLGVSMQQVIASSQGMFLLMVIEQLLMLSTYRPIIRLLRKRTFDGIGWQQDVFLFCLIVFQIIVIIIAVFTVEEAHARQYSLLLVGGFFAADIFIVLQFEHSARQSRLERQYRLYEQQETLMVSHYEELDRKFEQSRKVLHDIKDHIQAIEHLHQFSDTDAGHLYAMQLYQQIDSLGYSFKCSNRVLNVLINETLKTAELLQVKVQLNVQDVCLDFLRSTDITVIFANLLNNALEAAAALPEGERWISLRMHEFHENLVVNLSNSCVMPPRGGNSKSSKARHAGIGLSSVKNALERYDGQLEIVFAPPLFEAKLVIPTGN